MQCRWRGPGRRQEWPDSSFVTRPPTRVFRRLAGLGLGDCLPTPPGTLDGGLAGALRTVLLGPGGEVPAPGPTLPLPFPPQRSQATTALGRFLEELAHLWAHGDLGR